MMMTDDSVRGNESCVRRPFSCFWRGMRPVHKKCSKGVFSVQQTGMGIICNIASALIQVSRYRFRRTLHPLQRSEKKRKAPPKLELSPSTMKTTAVRLHQVCFALIPSRVSWLQIGPMPLNGSESFSVNSMHHFREL